MTPVDGTLYNSNIQGMYVRSVSISGSVQGPPCIRSITRCAYGVNSPWGSTCFLASNNAVRLLGIMTSYKRLWLVLE
jgi:hypothetical protein